MRLILFLLITTSTVFAQAKIEGIGPLKPGTTTRSAFFDNIKNADYQEVKLDSTETIRKGSLTTFPANAPIDPAVKVYKVSTLKISGVSLSDVYATFLNDTLVSLITAITPDLTDALTTKYGNGIVDEYQTKTSCPQTVGRIRSSTRTWNNPPISASLIDRVGYDANCRPEFVSQFEVVHLPSHAIFLERRKAGLAKLKAYAPTYKRAKLKDF